MTAESTTLYLRGMPARVVRGLGAVIAFDDEAIIGRDVLNRVRVLLDGPRLALSIR